MNPDALLEFARRYTAAWCSGEPARVASFFAADGSLTTGNAVRISGREEWRLGPDGLIAASRGHFDAADYERQLRSGRAATQASRLFQATPFLHVPDLTRALDLFTRVLGFELKFRVGRDYAYLERDGAAVRILEERGRGLPGPGQARMTMYVDVSDVDALYAALLPALGTLPAGDVQAPRDQPWNQREIHVRLPDGHWLAFGQPVAGRATESA